MHSFNLECNLQGFIQASPCDLSTWAPGSRHCCKLGTLEDPRCLNCGATALVPILKEKESQVSQLFIEMADTTLSCGSTLSHKNNDDTQLLANTNMKKFLPSCLTPAVELCCRCRLIQAWTQVSSFEPVFFKQEQDKDGLSKPFNLSLRKRMLEWDLH